MILTDKQLMHREYLKSSLWFSIRRMALEHYGEICAKCGGSGSDVHHLTYKRCGGNERMEDLQILCRECHEALHAIERATRKKGRRKKEANVVALFGYLTEKQRGIIRDTLGSEPYALIMSKSEDGEKARSMAMEMLGIDRVYGLNAKKRKRTQSCKSKRIHY
jgi:hypothetical protein